MKTGFLVWFCEVESFKGKEAVHIIEVLIWLERTLILQGKINVYAVGCRHYKRICHCDQA